MAEQYIEKRIHADDNGDLVDQVTTRSDESLKSGSSLRRISQVVTSIGALISGILLLRFILRLLNANASNGFVDFIYGLTQPIISPFQSMFSIDTATESTGGTFEIASVAAIIVISFAAWMTARFMQDAASDI
jgi:uncharacterized protein YggT (Ycf19 family)